MSIFNFAVLSSVYVGCFETINREPQGPLLNLGLTTYCLTKPNPQAQNARS